MAATFSSIAGRPTQGSSSSIPVHRSASLEKGEGLADDIFKSLGHLRGDLGIAHTRYKTYGGGGIDNAQPFFDPITTMALAHNGHITNVPQIETELGRPLRRR